ncbi:sulfotransferase family protein [Vibrio ziniensis]|uniref:Sulfotransferase n=1 Tax=Vibrio ziniensis TaxID=2711221 RepID=A0A6G7CQZ4_9VIBR|nr:sulfotransferase [Vibrio ziniensis]QIH44504.1 sulfotransferase [Vibrio ziniensis]
MNQYCHVLGIMPRSGTNYLENIISLHTKCKPCDPIYEDFLISQSELLIRFSKKVRRYWNPNWDTNNEYLTEKNLLEHIGYGLHRFLSSPHLGQEVTNDGQNNITISKTPSVKGIEHFFQLFPNSKLIILVRDGRAIVESGCKSFDWDFEKACFDWSRLVKRINAFIAENTDHKAQIKMVRYEDLINNTEEEVPLIFKFLQVNEDEVLIEDVKNLHISGSSETKKTNKEVTWQPKKMDDNFKPLERFSHWSRYKRRRFEWISGNSLISMGYVNSLERFTILERIAHTILDISWPIRVIPKTIINLIISRKFVLKTY